MADLNEPSPIEALRNAGMELYRQTARANDAEAALARVRALHAPWEITSEDTACAHCNGLYGGDTMPYPCPTIRAIDPEEDPTDE